LHPPLFRARILGEHCFALRIRPATTGKSTQHLGGCPPAARAQPHWDKSVDSTFDARRCLTRTGPPSRGNGGPTKKAQSKRGRYAKLWPSDLNQHSPELDRPLDQVGRLGVGIGSTCTCRVGGPVTDRDTWTAIRPNPKKLLRAQPLAARPSNPPRRVRP